MPNRVQVRGLNGVLANFRAWDKQLHAEIITANALSMDRVETGARFRCPYRTGLTQRSIKGELSELGLTFTVFVDEEPFRERGLVYYPKFVHDGTRFVDARPFLLEAFEEERARYTRLIRDAGRRSFRRAA